MVKQKKMIKSFLSLYLITSVIFLSISCRVRKSNTVLSSCSNGSETFKLTTSDGNFSKVLINEIELFAGEYLAADKIYKESCAEIFEAPSDEPGYLPSYVPGSNKGTW